MTDPVTTTATVVDQVKEAAGPAGVLAGVTALVAAVAKLGKMAFGSKPERDAGMKDAAVEWRTLAEDARQLMEQARASLSDCEEGRKRDAARMDALDEAHRELRAQHAECEKHVEHAEVEMRWMRAAINGLRANTPPRGITTDGEPA